MEIEGGRVGSKIGTGFAMKRAIDIKKKPLTWFF
jgi:hypothetical protein